MKRNRTDWREKEEVLTQNSSGSSRTSPVSSPLSLLSLALSPPMHQVRPDNLRDWRERFFFWAESACMRRDPPYSKLPLPVSTSPARDRKRGPFPMTRYQKGKLPPWHNVQTFQGFVFSPRWYSWVIHYEHIWIMNKIIFKGVIYTQHTIIDIWWRGKSMLLNALIF